MTAQGYALFDTAIGRCGVAWSRKGITALQLPEQRDADTRARLARTVTGISEQEPPPAIRAAIARIVRLLEGQQVDLSSVPLDMDGLTPFFRRVYDTAREIPPGRTMSYGEIAARIGKPGAARAVGQALGRNPFAIVVPCHRVLSANGSMGGFSAYGGTTTKSKLLAIEGARG